MQRKGSRQPSSGRRNDRERAGAPEEIYIYTDDALTQGGIKEPKRESERHPKGSPKGQAQQPAQPPRSFRLPSLSSRKGARERSVLPIPLFPFFCFNTPGATRFEFFSPSSSRRHTRKAEPRLGTPPPLFGSLGATLVFAKASNNPPLGARPASPSFAPTLSQRTHCKGFPTRPHDHPLGRLPGALRKLSH